MGFYKYVQELYRKPEAGLKTLTSQRFVEWRRQNTVRRIDRPTRIDRARRLGYRAKKGIIVLRVRVTTGGRKKEKPSRGRKSHKAGRRKIVSKSYQWIAEERAQRHYKNLNVLGSYEVGDDSKNRWLEVIMVDTNRPEIKADRLLNWLCSKKQKGRVFRGLTTSGKRSRGILTHKGKGAEKLRPSLRSHSSTAAGK